MQPHHYPQPYPQPMEPSSQPSPGSESLRIVCLLCLSTDEPFKGGQVNSAGHSLLSLSICSSQVPTYLFGIKYQGEKYSVETLIV